MIAIWPLLICLIGVLTYALASNGKLVEIGKWAYIVGLFWTVATLVGKTVSILK